jgi:hypothetical protein
MASPVREPYHYGSPAGVEHFCDREAVLDSLVARMLTRNNVILLSPRRYGKTSILLRAIDQVRAGRGATGYVSLIRCSSRREVAEAVAAGILNGPLSWFARRREGLKELLRDLRISPTLSVDPSGGIAISFTGAAAATDWNEVMGDALRLLVRRGDRHPASLVLDEFQRAVEIDPGLGGVFKAMADELRTTSLVFAGSKLHLMRRLATGPGAPLLGMGERISLDVIPEPAMTEYLCRRAIAGGKSMDPAVAQRIYTSVDGIPNDVQRLAFEAYLVAGRRVDDAAVDRGLERILSHQATDFAELYERLAPTQQRILRVLAGEPTATVYSAAFMESVDVSNPNAVRAALDVLAARELVRRAGRQWRVSNAFFRAWLQSPATSAPV